MTQAEHSILLKLTMAAGSLRSCAERPRVLLSESSKDSSSNGSVSSRLSFLFAQGHNTCRAPMEFATLTLPYLFKHLQIFFFGGGGGVFFIVPFNPSPIYPRSLSRVRVTVCASCQALSFTTVAAFSHAPRVQSSVAFQGNRPAFVCRHR